MGKSRKERDEWVPSRIKDRNCPARFDRLSPNEVILISKAKAGHRWMRAEEPVPGLVALRRPRWTGMKTETGRFRSTPDQEKQPMNAMNGNQLFQAVSGRVVFARPCVLEILIIRKDRSVDD